MKTQPLSIDPRELEESKAAAADSGMSWSAYAARAIHRQVMHDNMRRAAELDAQRTPEQIAEDETWHAGVAAGLAQRVVNDTAPQR